MPMPAGGHMKNPDKLRAKLGKAEAKLEATLEALRA